MVQNKSTKPLHLLYYAAFYDADGKLLGCTSTEGGEPPIAVGANRGYNCTLRLANDRIQRISRYEVVLYYGSTDIGAAGR
jgi:hypothetical protein